MARATLNLPLGPLLIDIGSLELNNEDYDILAHPLVGSVILFARNFENKEQVTQLIDQIKSIRNPSLLVCVDQEGGRVQRFKKGFTTLPALHSLGILYDEDPDKALMASKQLARLMAVELRGVDVDFSFAPVIDLFNANSKIIADRAFHHDPKIIGELAVAYMQGLHDVGMIAVAKHFPGHGGVLEDSHLCLPEDYRCYKDVDELDLCIYQILISQGLDAVLTAHVRFNLVDKMPSGFSQFWIQTILRKKMGFKGIIFTDDLTMQGAVEFGTVADRTRLALQAGCDFALICNDREAVVAVVDDASLQTFINPQAGFERRCRPEPNSANWQADPEQLAQLFDELARFC